MAETWQSMSSFPLQEFHTTNGGHDPLPLNASREFARINNQVKQFDAEQASDLFEDYLNQNSIMIFEKIQTTRSFNPVDEIATESVYLQPGEKTRI